MKVLLRESLLARLVAANLLLCTVLTAGLTLLFLWSYTETFKRQLHNQAENLADFLASQCQFALLVGDRVELEKVATGAVADEHVVFVEITDQQGGNPVRVSRKSVSSPRAPGTVIEVVRSVGASGGGISWGTPHAAPERLGVIRLGFSTDKERAARNQIVWTTSAIGLIGLLLTAGVQSVQIRSLLRPLQSLTVFTHRVAGGDLGGRAEVVRPDEVGRLTLAFNRMIEELSVTTVSRDYVDNIIRSMAESVMVIDPRGRIRTVNHATTDLLGYRREDLEGELIGKVCASPPSRFGQGIETEYVAAGGMPIPVLLSAAPMSSRGADNTGWVWVAQDLTTRKQTEEQLRRAKDAAEAADAAKTAFLAAISHELRTPLNAIIGYSQLLQETCQERGLEGFCEDLAKIERSGGLLLHLINQVLDFSKAEAGRIEIQPEAFDLRSVIQDVFTSVEPLAARNRNRLLVQNRDDISLVYTDLIRFRQSLINLVANACKFTECGDVVIDISHPSTAPRSWLEVSVRDTGIGISPEQQEKLFQAFVQGDTSTTRKYGGTGLGLAITRKFCRLMGGEVSVESQVGKGSKFIMRIPAGLEQPGAEEGIS